MEKALVVKRLKELQRLRTIRRYHNMTNAAFIKLLESYREGGTFRTTPEREAIRNKAVESYIRDVLLQQSDEWEQRGRCITCGEPVDPTELQCPECIEIRWLFTLLSTGLVS